MKTCRTEGPCSRSECDCGFYDKDHPMTARHSLDQIVRGLDGVTAECPCTTFEQDEDCQVGYPSLLCSACDGTGNAPMDKVVALAAEMMKIAEQVGELEDPFAAWETIDLIKSQNDQLRTALEKIADLTARCEHDGGFDREIGPIGCNLGDKCLCIGLHPIARTALTTIRRTEK